MPDSFQRRQPLTNAERYIIPELSDNPILLTELK